MISKNRSNTMAHFTTLIHLPYLAAQERATSFHDFNFASTETVNQESTTYEAFISGL